MLSPLEGLGRRSCIVERSSKWCEVKKKTRKKTSPKFELGPRWKLWFRCYQIAGGLLLGPDDDLTEGQRARLTELLLNVLSEPVRYSAKLVKDLEKMAVEP